MVFAALLALGGLYALFETPVDAIPDLSDVQVILKTSYPGQAPQVVEDQVTYPLTRPCWPFPMRSPCAAIRFSALPMCTSFFGRDRFVLGALARA